MMRARLIWASLWPTLVMWSALVAFAFWRDGQWPQTQDGWWTFLLLALIIEFLLTKALVMAVRMSGWIWLTVSLIAANAAFALVYLIVMAGLLWPRWYGEHLDWIRWSTRIGLAAVLIWGYIMLVNVPSPAALDEPNGETS
jgi:hypothetical protein